MKNIYYILLFFTALTFGQSQNYVKTTVYKKPNAASLLPAPAADQAVQSITYFDGLGRAVQQIAGKQSASGKDIVTHMEYDQYGRQPKEYLPYPSAGSGMDFIDGIAAVQQTLSYYQTAYADATPFSNKLFEASPLNRILKQASPGDVWKLPASAADPDHTIRLDYQANNSNEVRYFKAVSAWNAASDLFIPAFSDAGYYGKSQLYKTITKDENWVSGDEHTVQEFKDQQGHVVLKRSYGLSMVNGTRINEWHDTYYVYDQFGNLSFVLPPKVSSQSAIPAFHLENFCYEYRYDSRNRLAEKKLPEKGWEYLLYDSLDRIVATGPTNSPFQNLAVKGVRSRGWLFSKYDAFGRVALTGWTSGTFSSVSRKNLQATLNAQAAASMYETKTASGTTVNGISFWYTNVAWPTGTAYHVLTVNYYDDYNFPNAPASIPASIFADGSQPVYYNNSIKPKGLQTGSWVRVLQNTTDYANEKSYILYDGKSNAVRNYTQGYLGGYTQTDSRIDFSGKILFTETRHKRISGDAELLVREDFTYSDQDRLLTHTHKVNQNGDVTLLASNEYDELGQLVAKKVGNTIADPLQKVDFKYNIRGWLKGINEIDNLAPSGQVADLFSFKINYETLQDPANHQGEPLFNGNISQAKWRTASDNTERAYSYHYDALNRLTDAIYAKNGTATNSYNEDIRYDKNGNITRLSRTGDLDAQNQTIEIDNLEYEYNEGNQLQKVTDLSIHPAGFNDNGDDFNMYTYDTYGNVERDLYKQITFKYNHLNLPDRVIFDNYTSISYLYNAIGVKVKKETDYTTEIVSIDYINGFQYTNGVLSFFPTAEGYVKNTLLPNQTTGIGALSYIFNYKDHLGNIRLSYAKKTGGGTVIMEENHYYPFGLKHAKYGETRYYHVPVRGTDGYYTGGTMADIVPPFATNLEEAMALPFKYKYNGKELQDELQLNVYDYGARNYDPAIGRWQTMDNLSELYFDKSSYVYALNTPVQAIDPDGNVVIFINGQHTGDGGKSDYWRHSTVEEKYYPSAYGYMRSVQTVSHQFDSEVMSQLGDRNALYKDGAMGGFNNTLWETNQSRINLSSANRIQGGYDQGKKDAKSIIANLARDKTTGEIVETIKIITHSMGGSYGKGYVKALKEYIKTLPKEQQAQVKITLVADFDPFQAGSLKADKDIFTQQFTHLGNLAEQKQEGVDDYYEEKGDHSITTFFSSISNLQEGTYKWNGSEWQCTTCK